MLTRHARRQAPAGAATRMSPMRVGVVDVGANTLRLLVAERTPEGLQAIGEERLRLGLGDDVETGGSISGRKLGQAAEVAAGYVRRARKLGCARTEVLVTSPGRQASNGDDLLEALAASTGVPCRVLSAEEEGGLAWRGAVAATDGLRETVAVCDVGGGSTQLVVGTLGSGPAWSRSLDLGSLRLTRRAFHDDPPTPDELGHAERLAAKLFAELAPPLPLSALATGGTARNLRRVVARELGADELETAVRRLGKRTAKEIVKTYGVDESRARTLTAGAILLRSAQRRLGVPLVVARGGLREGAALALLAEEQAAAS
jgi:exopolyphosphatase/guanosine-5'-triphosphate,3'-diphosphate pyrophosphatase